MQLFRWFFFVVAVRIVASSSLKYFHNELLEHAYLLTYVFTSNKAI